MTSSFEAPLLPQSRQNSPSPPRTSTSSTSSTTQVDSANFSIVELDQFANGEEIQEESDPFIKDPFCPFDDLPDEDRNILTVRAITVGLLCGALVNASNIYLGLKSGWTASANIFGSILGFTLLSPLSTHFPHVPHIGMPFGPRENNIVQTTATAAGGMSSVFISAFPSMYQLGLFRTPYDDFWRITALTAVGGYLGLFFAAPLRKFFILSVARPLHLIFPAPSATAITIRSLHLAAGGASSARRKMKALSWALAISFIQRVASQYAVGVLWDWHIFTWLFNLGIGGSISLAFESWGWFLELTPAFIGTGIIVGPNVAISYFMGGVLAWGIIGPILVAQGYAFGKQASADPNWAGLTNYYSLTEEFTSNTHPSPRYWLLWPGVLCLIVTSFTELACQWRIFYFTGKIVWSNISSLLIRYLPSSSQKYEPITPDDSLGKIPSTSIISDPASDEDSVKTWMWLPGLLSTLVLTCIIMKLQYNMPISEALLALLLAFFFSFLAIQSTGATDITPVTAASKASQVILGTTTRGPEWTVQNAQRLNLLGGAIASIGANQASDLTSDFRVGFLLRTPPKAQYIAQSIGTLLATFLAPSIYILFSTAYPCINSPSLSSPIPNSKNKEGEKCPFDVPSASAWRAVAIAASSRTDLPIPPSSVRFSIILSLLAIVLILFRHIFLAGPRARYRDYLPNTMVMALAFIIPATVYGTAMLFGACISWWFGRKHKGRWEVIGIAIAAGGMAGEGLGGVLNAILQVLGLSGDVYGSGVGCPVGVC